MGKAGPGYKWSSKGNVKDADGETSSEDKVPTVLKWMDSIEPTETDKQDRGHAGSLTSKPQEDLQI